MSARVYFKGERRAQYKSGFTTGGDGTTIRNLNYKSMHIHVTKMIDGPDGTTAQHTTLFAEARQAANHRAETQKQGTTQFLHEVTDLYNRSPLTMQTSMSRQSLSSSLGTNSPFEVSSPPVALSVSQLAIKYHGSHEDHAKDQKATNRLLSEWKKELSLRGLGADHLLLMSQEERGALFLKEQQEMILQVGESMWNAMNEEEKKKSNLLVIEKLTEKLGEIAFNALPEIKRHRITIWAFSGCGMHKEMNAGKGGDLGMQEEWKKHGISPVLLPNKDNDAVLQMSNRRGNEPDDDDDLQEESAVEKRAREVSEAGGSKHSKLMGNLLNNADDKKGETILS